VSRQPRRPAPPFDVLSAIDSHTAKHYGLAFDLPDDLAPAYDKLGFELQRVNDDHPRTLRVPATYVIGRDGVIRWAFVDTDYTTRAEPPGIIAALDAFARSDLTTSTLDRGAESAMPPSPASRYLASHIFPVTLITWPAT
jgi:hypothetical protein